METLSIIRCYSSAPIKHHHKTLKFPALNFHRTNLPIPKNLLQQFNLPLLSTTHLLASLPSLASETLSSQTDQVSDKISLESILVSVDDFFTRYPVFVYCCAFIWLVAIPVNEQLSRKYRFIYAIDAFRKLKEDKDAQLLDIRDKKSFKALRYPNLKILDKSAAHVEFSEQNEDGFVQNVLEKFPDPANTTLCIMDNFDGNSMRAAELLFKNGFKEAYAIKGGIRGKKGWLEIQETLLPPSVHMFPKKKAKMSELEINGIGQQTLEENGSPSEALSAVGSQRVDNGPVNKSLDSIPHLKIDSRSPYPNYPDLKPPSSPTPSKP